MPARLVSDNGAHVVVRLLVYVTESEALLYAKAEALPIISCCCPVVVISAFSACASTGDRAT